MRKSARAINEEAKAHDEQFNKKKVKLIGFISFLTGFSSAFIAYITSSYLKLSSGSENLSPIYFIAYIITLFLFFHLHKMVKRLGKSNVFYFSLIAKIVIIFFLAISPPSMWTVIPVMLYIITGNIEWVSLDAILESFSTDKMSGRIRGKYLTLMNAGFLLGPYLSVKVLGAYGYGGVYAALLIFNAIVFIVALISLRNVNHKFNGNVTAKELLKKVWKRKNVLRIYYLSFALEFFYALTVIYVPLYLINLGFSWDRIGIILTVMLIPFVIIQYPLGILADKKMGEKELLILSLIIMTISTIALYFLATKNLAIWAAALFATRIGAAMLEILRDSYFYKRIDGHNVDLIDFFRTAMPMGFIVSSIITLPLLMFFSIKSTFIIVAIVVASALVPAFMLADNKCEEEMQNT